MIRVLLGIDRREFGGIFGASCKGLLVELVTKRAELGEVERILADPGYASFSHHHYAYRARGQYAEQLERLEKIFGRERLHVVDSKSFFTDPEPVYHGVLEFLGLPHGDRPVFRRRNARPRPPMAPAIRAALEEHYRPHDEQLAGWLGHQPSWRVA